MRDHGPILVPLDGSDLAEGALPYAAALARALRERVVLLTVWEGAHREFAHSRPEVVADIERAANENWAQYLEGVRNRFFDGIDTQTEVRESDDAAEAIEGAARELGARIIVLATHGRSGVGRWLYGGVANHVLRHSDTPVLVAGPHALERAGAAVKFTHIMVPLDGAAIGEAALPVALSLAKTFGARISLTRALRFAAEAYPYTLPDAYLPQLDDELDASAKAYLSKVEAGITGVPVDAFVIRGGIADGLIEFVDKQAIDLVVMTTHARGGIGRAVLGSTADRMVQCDAPVLLIRPVE